MVITSLENEKIKNLVKLQKKKYRDLTNTYLIEGEHLVNEAIKAGTVLEIFLLENESFSSSSKILFPIISLLLFFLHRATIFGIESKVLIFFITS